MGQYTGEILSLIVAVSWTATAIFADIASHRLGAVTLNLIRMALTPVLIIVPYALINHQKISFKEVLGTLVTVIGVAMFFLL